MIELYMFFAMGFLTAALSVLVVVPLVHRRAARLTRHQVESKVPASMAEIVAHKDLLRAEFAMSTRRLEVDLEELNAKSARERAELENKRETINRLTMELNALRGNLNAPDDKFVISTYVNQSERPLSVATSQHPATQKLPDETAAVARSQTEETAALRLQVQSLNEWLAQAGAEIRAVNAEHVDLESATQRLAEERDKFQSFHRRVAELVQQMVRQSIEDKMLSDRVRELESHIARQSQILDEQESKLVHLQRELEFALKAEADLRSSVIEIEGRAYAATNEKQKLQASLDRANGERLRLAYELDSIRRKGGQPEPPVWPTQNLTQDALLPAS